MRLINNLILIILLSTCLVSQIVALDTTEFSDKELQNRYQVLTNELRCLVCQNESIAGSNSELAQDLRNQVAEQLRAGQSDGQIRAYMTERYGDFIHYRPPNQGRTKLLWLAPILLFVILALIFMLILLKNNAQVVADEGEQ